MSIFSVIKCTAIAEEYDTQWTEPTIFSFFCYFAFYIIRNYMERKSTHILACDSAPVFFSRLFTYSRTPSVKRICRCVHCALCTYLIMKNSVFCFVYAMHAGKTNALYVYVCVAVNSWTYQGLANYGWANGQMSAYQRMSENTRYIQVDKASFPAACFDWKFEFSANLKHPFKSDFMKPRIPWHMLGWKGIIIHNFYI